MACLAGTTYDPATAVTKSTASPLAMTALDTTNLRLTFTVPSSGMAMFRLLASVHGATTFPSILLGVMRGGTVIARVAPIGGLKTTAVATAIVAQEACFVVSGLGPGISVTCDAAYGVETGVTGTGIKYGGPNNATANDAFGGFVFEVWSA